MYNPSMSITMSVSQARAALPRLLDRVAEGEQVTLTRHGQPVAVVVRPDALGARLSDRSSALLGQLHEAFEAARRTPLSQLPPISDDRAEELIAEVQAGRSAR